MVNNNHIEGFGGGDPHNIINGDNDEIPDDIIYTNEELDDINNTSYLILELEGNERGFLNQLIYLRRLIIIYDIYNHLLSKMYKNIYGGNPIHISTITIGIHNNFSGLSIMFNNDDIVFRQEFIEYLANNEIHHIILETGSVFLDWSSVYDLHNNLAIFNLD
jgi:hypothetical protein